MIPRRTFYLAAAALLLHACSSRPREFVPTLAAAPTDQSAYAAAYDDCRAQVASGKQNSSNVLASGGAGAAAGLATGAVGTAAASGTTTFVGGMAAAGATLVAMPVVAVLGAWGMAKSKKLKKEKAIQAATAACLAEQGYQVADWQRAKD